MSFQGEIEKLEEEKKSLNEELVNSKKMAKEAEKELAIWQSKAEKAESNVKRAEKTLEKALQDHSATQSALIQVTLGSAPFVKDRASWASQPRFSNIIEEHRRLSRLP